MFNDEISWNKKTESSKQSGPHNDYEKNKETCRLFVSNVRSQLLKGMGMKMCDSEGLPQGLFEIYWIPPPYAKTGRFSHRIFLHQPNNSFSKELQETFSQYYQMANDFIKKEEERGIFALDGSKINQNNKAAHGIVFARTARF